MEEGKKSFEEFFGVMEPKPATIEKTGVLKNNLKVQHKKYSEEIAMLEARLAEKKEYLAKIEGGLDVIEELEK